MKRIRNNDLTHYFFRDHKELPESYLKSCKDYFKKIGIELKEQATSAQATSNKQDTSDK